MPKKLEEIIREHSILSEVFKNCRDLEKEGNFRDALDEFRNIPSAYSASSIDTVFEDIDVDKIYSILNEVASSMIASINSNVNGIVLHSDGTIDDDKSKEEAEKEGIPVPDIVLEQSSDSYNIGKILEEDFSSGFLKNINEDELSKDIWDYMNNQNAKTFFDLGLVWKNDFNFNEEIEDILNDSTENKKDKADSFITKTIEQNQDLRDVYRNASIKSWLNDKQQVYKMRFLCLALEKNKTDSSIAKHTLKKFIEEHSEYSDFFKSLLDETGEVSREAQEDFASYSSNLVASKLLDHYEEKAKSGFNFHKASNKEKCTYIMESLVGASFTGDKYKEMRELAITRLGAIEEGLVKTDKETGGYVIDEEAIVNLYNKFSSKRDRKVENFDELIELANRIYSTSVVKKQTTLLTDAADKNELVVVDMSDREKAFDEILGFRMKFSNRDGIDYDFSKEDMIGALTEDAKRAMAGDIELGKRPVKRPRISNSAGRNAEPRLKTVKFSNVKIYRDSAGNFRGFVARQRDKKLNDYDADISLKTGEANTGVKNSIYDGFAKQKGKKTILDFLDEVEEIRQEEFGEIFGKSEATIIMAETTSTPEQEITAETVEISDREMDSLYREVGTDINISKNNQQQMQESENDRSDGLENTSQENVLGRNEGNLSNQDSVKQTQELARDNLSEELEEEPEEKGWLDILKDTVISLYHTAKDKINGIKFLAAGKGETVGVTEEIEVDDEDKGKDNNEGNTGGLYELSDEQKRIFNQAAVKAANAAREGNSGNGKETREENDEVQVG